MDFGAAMAEDFSHNLENILHRMKVEILKEHEHEVQIAKLRTKALLGKSGDMTFGVPAAQQAHQARKMLQRMRTADLERKQVVFDRQTSGSKDTSSKADIKIATADDFDLETIFACTTESSDCPPPPPAVPEDITISPRSPKRAFHSHDENQLDIKDGSGLPAERTASHRSAASHGAPQLPGTLEQTEDGERNSRNSRNSQGSRRQSEHSTISVMSLPSFFKDREDHGTSSRWRHFLKDAESSRAANYFAFCWNFFILGTVFFSLSQAASSWHSGMAGGLVEGSFEIIFFAEFVFGLLLEPMKMVALKDLQNFIDICAVLPLILRIENSFEFPTLEAKPVSHYILVGVVPTVRLLKLIRRFGKLSLVSHALSTTGDALKLLLFLLSVIVLCFSTMMYIVEPKDNITSLTTAIYICTVTVTTVGYGDVTPKSNAGRALAGILCFISVLFMAMPISLLGNAMTHAWADRSRILLMTRTRQRLKNYGYEASDMPSLFRKFDSNGNGELTMDEFCDMIGKMNVGIRPSEAEELFELFDTDASGGIDDKEFMKALFPDDYRRIYMRTTTNTMSFQ